MKPIYKILIAIFILGLAAAIFVFMRSRGAEPILTAPDLPAPSSADIQIVAFGDSLTAGYNLPSSESYPAQLEAKLRSAGYSARVINSGVSGETTRGNLERAEFIRSQNPDIVILGIGGNDALRSLPVAETKANIEQTIQILKGGANPPRVFLLQMQSPLNSGFAYKQSFDAIYPSLASTYGLELIPFLTAAIFLDESNLLSDGIHLNRKGYGLAVDQHIFPAVTKNLPQLKN